MSAAPTGIKLDRQTLRHLGLSVNYIYQSWVDMFCINMFPVLVKSKRLVGVLPLALQVSGSSTDTCNTACRRNVISGDFVPQKQQNMSTVNGPRSRNILRLQERGQDRTSNPELWTEAFIWYGIIKQFSQTTLVRCFVTHKFAEERRTTNVSGFGIPRIKNSIWSIYAIPKSAPFLKMKESLEIIQQQILENTQCEYIYLYYWNNVWLLAGNYLFSSRL